MAASQPACLHRVSHSLRCAAALLLQVGDDVVKASRETEELYNAIVKVGAELQFLGRPTPPHTTPLPTPHHTHTVCKGEGPAMVHACAWRASGAGV